MSFLYCFLCLQINIEANATANVYYSYPTSNLFFIHPGFANPSISRGLLGFALNPAGLMSAQKGELMVTFAPAMQTQVLTEFAVPTESLIPMVDTVNIPTDIGVQQIGGVDFIGALFRLGGWRFAVGYQKGDHIQLDLDARIQPPASYEIEYDDTLTHSDIDAIPVGDSVPVHVKLKGKGNIFLLGEANADFRTNSLVFALASKLFGADFGLGCQITPVALTGNFSALSSGNLAAAGEVSMVSTGDWTVNATFGATLNVDSLINCYGQGDMSFYLSSFFWGIKKEWRYVSLGLCGDFSFPTFINGNWDAFISLPSEELPRIDYNDTALVIDTLNKEISGYGDLIIYDFEMDDSTYQGVARSPFLATAGLSGGMSFRFWRFETGCFAGANSSSDRSYWRIRAGVNLGFRTFVPLYAGVIFHWQQFNIAGLTMTALPVISFGGGTNFNIKNLDVFFSLSGNTTQVASLVIPSAVGGVTTSRSLVSVGLGLRFRF